MKRKVIIHQESDGYWAEVPAIPGCVSQADSFADFIAKFI